ncbi:phosphogluconate dehydratase [Marinihelvus fidelis]|uniref:Phosphogluconate dehydratase n=1 Tax=Marinihelvus fidelis TaxID=2613842 RepID=A0A5N0T6G9_9GAMM|nr:phosphogluconate dehydratase [Marinihelvus fidelis]KAA9130462.1 phosphogluconate dehydratase [Marinihelvus fidelis]
MHATLKNVTERIIERSRQSRADYLARIDAAAAEGPGRGVLSCGNLAHGFAACGAGDKTALSGTTTPNIAIVSSYNDMLSAHQPLETFPALIKRAAHEAGAVAQYAGGVPAMCDGVTQGQPGMELSLFSRDVIAMATAVALSHNMFDAAICLGVCDKIVPGLVIGALAFGHLPMVFAPAGPMPSGLPNKEKARVREEYAAGKCGRDELLRAESESYHSAGTCTFYGTANSNQMLMEFMGLQLPGGSFVNPNTALRDALTEEAVRSVLRITRSGEAFTPIGHIVDEKAIVNGIVGLLATGGSTNHTIHLIAMAAAAGVVIDWDDFAELSSAVPLLARVYPNGSADVNHFHAAGGLGFCIGTLLEAGLLHEDVTTILGDGLSRFCQEPTLEDGAVGWKPAQATSLDTNILRPADAPFDDEGGIRLVQGNLGRSVVKISAVPQEQRVIEAAARVFPSQQAFVDAFNAGEFKTDMVAVIAGQGASANGMPELHKLTPFLRVLQDSGLKVALLTDGRMSGASGQVLAAIHLTPDTVQGGLIARVRDGDTVVIDADRGVLELQVDEATLASREPMVVDPALNRHGMGRELFEVFRRNAGASESGASVFGPVA